MSMTTEHFRWCESNENFSVMITGSGPRNAPTKYYRVSYGPMYTGPYSHNWHCECPAFKFGKGKECKHIKRAKTMQCSYGHMAIAGSPSAFPIPDKCPKCGGRATVVKVAV